MFPSNSSNPWLRLGLVFTLLASFWLDDVARRPAFGFIPGSSRNSRRVSGPSSRRTMRRALSGIATGFVRPATRNSVPFGTTVPVMPSTGLQPLPKADTRSKCLSGTGIAANQSRRRLLMRWSRGLPMASQSSVRPGIAWCICIARHPAGTEAEPVWNSSPAIISTVHTLDAMLINQKQQCVPGRSSRANQVHRPAHSGGSRREYCKGTFAGFDHGGARCQYPAPVRCKTGAELPRESCCKATYSARILPQTLKEMLSGTTRPEHSLSHARNEAAAS